MIVEMKENGEKKRLRSKRENGREEDWREWEKIENCREEDMANRGQKNESGK